MINKNNKGFTILELLVVIFIITTVIFIGYKVINKSIQSSKEQGNINSEQLSMNNINKYLTKDLEQATSIKLILYRNSNEENYELIADTEVKDIKNNSSNEDILKSGVEDKIKPMLQDNSISKFRYEYIIRDNHKSESDDIFPRYMVDVENENMNAKYSISSIDKNGIKLDFVSKESINNKNLPFTIIGNNPYKVSVGYESKKNVFNTYDFEVVSRIGNIIVENIEIPDIPNQPQEPEKPIEPPPVEDIPHPEDIDKEKYQAIGFWTADKLKVQEENGEYKDSLYTWIDNSGQFGSQNLSSQEKFYIKGDNDNGNSSKSNAYIGYDEKYLNNQAKVNNNSSKANNIDKIKIYVSPYSTLEDIQVQLGSATFKGIIEVGKLDYLSKVNNKYKLEGNKDGTWYEVIFSKHNNNKVNFIINGKLYIDKAKVTSGYGMVVYGEQNNSSSSNGYIIYDWKNDRIKSGR